MLEITDLRKSFKRDEGELEVLSGISFRVENGEFLAVHGPSGSGKTTLLLTTGALLCPDSGTVVLDNQNPFSLSRKQRSIFRSEKIGFVFQQFYLMGYLNVLENVLLPELAANGKKLRERAIDLIEELGLSARINHIPSQLSVGEKQRVALARALLRSPSVLLADEPTGNLDPDNSEIVIKKLKQFAQNGGHVIMVTHSRDASDVADRKIELEQ